MRDREHSQDIRLMLQTMVDEMMAAPEEFWIQEHRSVVYHAQRLINALERLEDSGYSGPLVERLRAP